jgi:hypothetical protein
VASSVLGTTRLVLGMLVAVACGTLAPTALWGQAAGGARPAAVPDLTPELAAVRESLERYRDPILAVHDGYFSTLACVEYPNGAWACTS